MDKKKTVQKTDELLTTIQSLYAAALNGALWPEALRRAEALLKGHATFLYAVDTISHRYLVGHITGIPRHLQEEYASHYIHCDPRTGYNAINPTPEIQYDYMHIDEAGISQNEFYEWCRNFDGRYYIGGRLLARGPVHAYYAVQRSPRAGHVQDVDIDMFKTLYPHLRQAVELSVTAHESRLHRLAVEEALESVDRGVVLLGARGELLFANRAASEMAASGNGMQLSAEGIRATRAQDDERLRTVVSAAISTARGLGIKGGGTVVLPKRTSSRPYSLQVTPLPGKDSEADLLIVTRPAAVVYITDPDRQARVSTSQLQALFDLTPRETELCIELASGATLAIAAKQMGISPRTAQVHLRNVFSKTGTRRQSELISLIMDVGRGPSLGTKDEEFLR